MTGRATRMGLDPDKIRTVGVAAIDRLRRERPDVVEALELVEDRDVRFITSRFGDQIAILIQDGPGSALVLEVLPRAALLPDAPGHRDRLN